MRFKLDEKWVVIDSNARNVINAMKEALEKKVPLPEQRNELDSNTERPREKLSAKLAGWVEFATGEWGKNEYKFLAVDKDLDYPAWVLCDEYRNALYEKLREQGKGSRDTESESIYSRHVLICEILLRFAVIALSREENGKRDGELLINALDEFCEIIRRKGYLSKSDWLTQFGKFFATKHGDWLKCLREASGVIKSIHSNKKAISDTLDYLGSIRYQIMRQIVAFSGVGSFIPDDLSNNWISNTFQQCEALMLNNAEDVFSSESEMQLTAWSTTTARQDVILSNCRLKDRMRELYKLLNDTNLLLNITLQIDMLMNETGWVLILIGAFKPSALSEMIFTHHMKCTELLNLSEDDPIFGQMISKGLAKYQATSVHHLDVLAQESSENLMKLESPKVINRMVSLIGGSLNALLNIQDQLECKFIDKEILGRIAPKLLPAPSASEPALLAGFSRDRSLQMAKGFFAGKR